MDGGATWSRQGQVPGQPAAVSTYRANEVDVATDTEIYRSTDDGGNLLDHPTRHLRRCGTQEEDQMAHMHRSPSP